MRCLRLRSRDQRGFGLVELLVAMAVFALFFLLIDTVFIGTHQSSQKAELAADVQQNARIAVERLSREIRESDTGAIRIGGTSPRMSVVFKSARLAATPEVFCMYVRTTTDPNYDSRCFYGGLTPPPAGGYTFPVAGCPPPAVPGNPTQCAYGTYAPIWQRYIGYWAEALPDGSYQVHRVTVNLTTPGDALPDPDRVLTCPGVTCGDIIATYVRNFTISTSGTNFSITLDARGTKIVQGTQIPTQEILLNGTTLIRN